MITGWLKCYVLISEEFMLTYDRFDVLAECERLLEELEAGSKERGINGVAQL